MTSDGSPWRSGSADFDDVGFSLVKRDIEVLMMAVQNLRSGLASAGLNQSQVEAIVGDVLTGRIPWPITEGGTGATDAATARSNLGLGDIATLTAPLPVGYGGTGAIESGGALANLRVFYLLSSPTVYTAGTYTVTVPANMHTLHAQFVGGGGGGGSYSGLVTTGFRADDSGGYLYLARSLMSGQGGAGGLGYLGMPVTPGESLTLVVGAGGAGAANSAGVAITGATGGSTYIQSGGGVLVVCAGGVGGGGGVVSSSLGAGGAAYVNTAQINRVASFVGVRGNPGASPSGTLNTANSSAVSGFNQTQPAYNGSNRLDTGAAVGGGGRGMSEWGAGAYSGGVAAENGADGIAILYYAA